MHHYPDRYVSKHVLVMFTNTPYADALLYGQLQGELLNKICLTVRSVKDVNWQEVDILMNQYDKKLAKLPLAKNLN